jgi:fructokinase
MAHAGVSIGVDLGGTKIEAVVFDRAASSVVRRDRVETHRERGYESIVETTANLIFDIARTESLDLAATPIGVGMPGSVQRRTGLVKNSNTVCLNGRPFRDDLVRRLGRPIAFANAANCFALAEARLGAGKPYVDGVVFGVIMGSGVGGGIVVAGKEWPGLQNIAGEWGHHAVGSRGSELGSRAICYCGQTGCVELYLAGPFIEAEYQQRSTFKRDLATIAARRNDDAHAASVLDEALDAFVRGIATVIDILDPTAIVLGGGVSNLDLFYTEGVERVKNYVFNDELETPILRHAMGDSAGVLGAALLDV